MGMRGGLFPAQTQAHLIQQAQMARMQAQRHQHTQVNIENFLKDPTDHWKNGSKMRFYDDSLSENLNHYKDFSS